jgi:glutaredoxin
MPRLRKTIRNPGYAAMSTIEIYTSPLCGYCHAAKRLLTDKGVSYAEYDVMRAPGKRQEMLGRANGGTRCRRSSSATAISAATTISPRWTVTESSIRF